MVNTWTAKDLMTTMELDSMPKLFAEYDPDIFWYDMGKIFKSRFDHRMMNENYYYLIPRLIALRPETILEIGCGFGRWIPFILARVKTLKHYTGLEISETMVKDATEYTKAYDKSKFEIINTDITSSNVPSTVFKKYDVVFSHACLTHIDPKHIPLVTTRIKDQLASKYIIHIERFRFKGEHPQPHRWSHELSQYYDGWKILEYGVCNEENHTNALILERI